MREKQIADAVVADVLLERKLQKAFFAASLAVIATCVALIGAMFLCIVSSYAHFYLSPGTRQLLEAPLAYAALAFIPALGFMKVACICLWLRGRSHARLQALGISGYGEEPLPLIPAEPKYVSLRGTVRFTDPRAVQVSKPAPAAAAHPAH